jgi:hypothetical protein
MVLVGLLVVILRSPLIWDGWSDAQMQQACHAAQSLGGQQPISSQPRAPPAPQARGSPRTDHDRTGPPKVGAGM